MAERLGRRAFLGGAAATAAGLVLLRAPGAVAAPPVSPRVAYGPDAARSVRLGWSTPTAVSGLRAEVGLDGSYGRTLPVETRQAPGHGVRYHHVLVDGLDPATQHHYRVQHDGGSFAGTFTTAPDAAVPFSFVAFGDQGDGDVADAVGATIRQLDPDLVFLVGDLSYASKTGGLLPGGILPPTVDHAVWDRWLALVSRSGGDAVPWLAGVGNHEIEDGQGELGYDGYLARLALPGNGPDGVPTAWTARHGNVAFVNLDGNDVSYEISRNLGWTGGAQTRWLATELAALRRDPVVDWIVVGFHHCAYCSNAVHGSDGGIREAWGALFDEHEVDLVVNGHNHCYERAHPVRAGQVADHVAGGATWESRRGTTYLTAGGGGQASYPTFVPGVSYVSETPLRLPVPELADWSAVADASSSVVAVDVTPPGPDGTTSLAVRAVSSTGGVLDRFTLVRRHVERAAVPAVPSGAGVGAGGGGGSTGSADPPPVGAPGSGTGGEPPRSLPKTGSDDTARLLLAAGAAAGSVAARWLAAQAADPT